MNLGIIAVATTVELMSRLVAVPSSTADIPKVNEAQELMAAYLGEHGVACTLETMPTGRKVLYASALGGKTPDLMLSVHLDVVPGNPGQYELKQEGDIVRGRGVRDCKGPCAAVANAMIALNGKASVGVIFGADEEKGGHSTRFMVEKGYRPRKMVVVVDGPDWNKVVYAQKGHAYFRVTAKGKGGHSSRPWLANDSIGALCRAVARAEDEWAAKNPLPDDKWGDVLTVTWLGADGGAYNRIPDDASAVFDLRSIAADSADRVEAFLREATGLHVERISSSQPCSSDPKHPLSIALRDTLRRHIPGEAIPFDRLNAATDARCFHDCGVPVMVVAIKGGDGHGSNEWADIPSIDRMRGMLEDFALTNFAASAFTFYNIVPNVVGESARLADAMAEYRERTGNSLVLCCMPLVPQGYPAADRADALIKGWRDFAAACRARDPGLRPGVLIQSFLGHGMFNVEEPRREGWTHSVNAAGREVRRCPLDPSFRAYIVRCVKLIAAERPAFVMTDDDLRSCAECFCPLHVAELNRRTGKSLSSDEWRRRISAAAPGDPDCLAFFRLMRETVRGVHALVRSALDEVDPSIPAGMCEGGEEYRFSDSCAVAIAAKGQRPVCRISSGLYLEQQRGEYPFQTSLIRQQTIAAVHSGEADLLDEADTFPQNLWSRSAVGLHTHLVSAIMNGLKGAKVWFVNAWRPQEGSVPAAYTDLLAKYAGFYQTLAAEVASMRPYGVVTPLRVDPMEYHPCRPSDNFPRGDHTWSESTFSHFGVPFASSPDIGQDAIYELAGTNMVMRMADGELRTLLSRRLLLDGRAALALCSRGYADLIGVDVSEKAPPFTFEAWAGTRDTCGPLRNADNAPGFTLLPGAAALTYLRYGRFNEEGEYTYQPANASAAVVAPGTTIFTNSLGGTVCATAYGDYVLFFQRFCPARKKWLDRVLRELNGGIVEYTVLNEQDFSVLVRESSDRRTAVVAAMNFNLESVTRVEVALSSRPAKVETLVADGAWRAADAEYADGRLSVKVDLSSWGVAVLRISR